MSTHNRKLLHIAVVASVLAHLILGAVLWYLDKGKNPTRSIPATQEAIQSYIYVAPPKPLPEPVVEPEQPIAEPEVAEPLPDDSPAPEQPVQEVETPSFETVPAKQAEVDMPIAPSTSQRANAPTSAQVLSKYFSNRNRLALDQLSQQGAQHYRENKNRPILPEPRETLSADEQLLQDVTTEIDCGSGIGQSLAFVSGMVGGTLRCGRNPEVDKFIDARINPKTHRPISRTVERK